LKVHLSDYVLLQLFWLMKGSSFLLFLQVGLLHLTFKALEIQYL